MDLSSRSHEMISELNEILQPYLLDNHRVYSYDWTEGWVFFKETEIPRVMKRVQAFANISRYGLKQSIPSENERLILVINEVEWIPVFIKDPSMELYALQLFLV